MPAKAAYLTPMLHVADVRRSIAFYRLLGLELTDYEGDPSCLGWARMHGEGGDLMFLVAETPIDPSKQAFFLYLYTDELPALREHLLANGVKVSGINRPPYMPSGEISVPDPDGYGVFVGQWGTEEHQRWERERRERLAKL
jgi:catechol 2,3-dioxygenase-like lactoylglutathione lyase family enzyme